MALPASGTITWNQICAEFSLNPATAVWPASFYGKGGAPASGTLGFADFYGRSGAPSITVSISPATSNTTTNTNAQQGNFTAVATGGTPTAYAWGVSSVVGGLASVVSGGTTSVATLRLTDGTRGDGEGSAATFYCDMTIGGVVYRAYTDLSHNWTF